jgi:Ca2+-binding RTX toxin-like protein
MGSRRRPPATAIAETRSYRYRRGSSPPSARVFTLLGLLGALLGVGTVLIASATARPGCGSEQKTNAKGTIAYGSECSDEILITSPLVKKVYAGDGDDVIYATDEVEEVYGGEGDDQIYGELPETAAELGVDYEPASGAEVEGEEGALASRIGASFLRMPVATASERIDECTTSCYGGDGSQDMFGGPGSDTIFGQRGNDTLHGEGGFDALYGGIGDDTVFGNDGADLLSGGFGTDTLDGGNNDDVARGDATVDVLRDTGSTTGDTLSFATAVAPGFRGTVSVPGFPPDDNSQERGVDLRLDGNPAPCGTQSCNNDARYGGGGDQISVAGFENVTGSPFSDRIVGSAAANRIDGGGGADIIEGGSGNDRLSGGADGDYLKGDAGTDRAFGEAGVNNCATDIENRFGCAGTAVAVSQRDRAKISVGYVNSPTGGGVDWIELFMVGSEGTDLVNAKYAPSIGQTGIVTFTVREGSAVFDTSAEGTSSCSYAPFVVKCNWPLPLDAITLAGMGGDDTLSISTDGSNWPDTVTPVLLGGQGSDVLMGSGQTEDVLVDGDGFGNDTLLAYGFHDALINNEGTDNLQGGDGSDLLISTTTCDGDILQGAEGKEGDDASVNNASWAQMPASAGGVAADLTRKTAGGQLVVVEEPIPKAKIGGGGADHGKEDTDKKWTKPACASGALSQLRNIDDLEGSSQSDALYGNARDNNLLGRNGEDLLFARSGEDRIAAQDGEADEIGGGGGDDICAFDEGLDQVDRCDP